MGVNNGELGERNIADPLDRAQALFDEVEDRTQVVHDLEGELARAQSDVDAAGQALERDANELAHEIIDHHPASLTTAAMILKLGEARSLGDDVTPLERYRWRWMRQAAEVLSEADLPTETPWLAVRGSIRSDGFAVQHERSSFVVPSVDGVWVQHNRYSAHREVFPATRMLVDDLASGKEVSLADTTHLSQHRLIVQHLGMANNEVPRTITDAFARNGHHSLLAIGPGEISSYLAGLAPGKQRAGEVAHVYVGLGAFSHDVAIPELEDMEKTAATELARQAARQIVTDIDKATTQDGLFEPPRSADTGRLGAAVHLIGTLEPGAEHDFVAELSAANRRAFRPDGAAGSAHDARLQLVLAGVQER